MLNQHSGDQGEENITAEEVLGCCSLSLVGPGCFELEGLSCCYVETVFCGACYPLLLCV
jgi:hypothetical protein